MEFKPRPYPHPVRLWGILILWGIGVLGAALWLVRQPFSFRTYVGGLVIGVAFLIWLVTLYRAWALARLRYGVDRNGLHIRWGMATFTLPMTAITTVHAPDTLPLHLTSPWWRWPAPFVGQWLIDDHPLYLFATHPPADMWLLCGPDVCVGITPVDGPALVEALNRRRRLGPTRVLSTGWAYPRLSQHPFWQDSLALSGVFFGALLLVVLWGEVSIRTSLIGVQQVAQVVTLLVLGDWILGAILYRRERLPALVLWWTGALMVAAFLVHLWVGA